MDYIDTPRDPDKTLAESVGLLEDIQATVDRLKPGLEWRPIKKSETSMLQCSVGDDRRPGTYFQSGLRQTLYVPTEQEWQQWSAEIIDLANQRGYESPSELPLEGGDHSLRMYTPDGDWLEVAFFDTGAFSFRMKTICAPKPQ